MSNLLNRLSERKMPSKDVRICLDLNLLAERDEAMARLASAQRLRRDDDRMVTPPAVTEAHAAVSDVEARIRAASIVIRFTGVDRSTYNRFFLLAPPRKGRQEAFDTSKFFMVVARETGKYVDEAGAVHDMSAEEWDEIDKIITDGEHDRIAQAVLDVNREVGGNDIGFLGDDSATTRDSFGISASRAGSASPRAASGAGNRKSAAKKS
jgi:hypothetical protein